MSITDKKLRIQTLSSEKEIDIGKIIFELSLKILEPTNYEIESINRDYSLKPLLGFYLVEWNLSIFIVECTHATYINIVKETQIPCELGFTLLV